MDIRTRRRYHLVPGTTGIIAVYSVTMTMKGVVACRIFIYMVIHNIPGMIISMNEYMSTYIYHSYMFKYIVYFIAEICFPPICLISLLNILMDDEDKDEVKGIKDTHVRI